MSNNANDIAWVARAKKIKECLEQVPRHPLAEMVAPFLKLDPGGAFIARGLKGLWGRYSSVVKIDSEINSPKSIGILLDRALEELEEAVTQSQSLSLSTSQSTGRTKEGFYCGM